MTSLRVLVLFEYPTVNGGERSFLAVAPRLMESGCGLIAAVPPDSPLARACRATGMDVVDSPICGAAHSSQDERRTSLSALIRHIQPDLVHANSLSMSRLAGPVARELNVPSVGYLRDIVKLSHAAIRDTGMNDRLVAVSRATREHHVGRGLPGPRTVVVYNGIDAAVFAPAARSGWLQEQLGIAHSSRVVICVGQLGMRKGTDVVMESFADLVQHFPDLHLAIIGERNSGKQEAIEFERRLKRRAGRSTLHGRVHFTGRIEAMAQVMADAILLLHGARQEPLGRVLLEASSAALPWVATDVGGTREIIGTPPFFDPLVPKDDDTAMATQAARLLSAPQLAEKLGQFTRLRMEQHFSVESCATSLYRIYCDVVRWPAS